MERIIEQISNGFMQEALASPRMLEDLAAMEKYMSESYDGRTFIELVQNADDANSSRISVFAIDDTLIIANNGRPFDENDIMAISRSGSSNKQRGSSIGYRGVGFKSATTISSEIVIQSSNAFFTFSKKLCASALNKSPEKVPTIRIPFPYNSTMLSNKITEAIEEKQADGFTTFFIFLKADIKKFESELDGFNNGWLIFLNNINCIDIKLSNNKICKVIRKPINDSEIIVKAVGTKEQWYVVSKNGVSIAFKYDDERGILPCELSEANIHCFLPTIDKTGFSFKINADFSTDPSRKHLILDEATNNALKSIEYLFAEFVQMSFEKENEKLMKALSLINSPISLGELSSQIEQGILGRLKAIQWVPQNDGIVASPENVRLFPSWLSLQEEKFLVEKFSEVRKSTLSSSIKESIEGIDRLLYKLGAKELSTQDLAILLKTQQTVDLLSNELLGKLFVYCCRTMFSETEWMNEVYIPLENKQKVRIADADSKSKLCDDFAGCLDMLNSRERTTLSEHYDVFACLKNSGATISKKNASINLSGIGAGGKGTNLAINKWKTPIQNCIAVETLNGWNAKDVSKKNAEYDVQCTNASGITRYIAVKNIGFLGDAFKLSDAEYMAAQRLGENYEIFLIATEGAEIDYFSVKNPYEALKVEKIVKEWEWSCESYSFEKNVPVSDEVIIDTKFLKNMNKNFFNSEQTEVIKELLQNKRLSTTPKLNIIATQINSITDFHTAQELIKIDSDGIEIVSDKFETIKKLFND